MNAEGLITRKLFRKYGLDVLNFNARNYLVPDNLFPNERDHFEVRVVLGRLCDMDWFKSQYDCTTAKQYIEMYKSEPDVDFIKDLDRAKKKKHVMDTDGRSLEFSVFTKKFDGEDDDTGMMLSISSKDDILYAFEQAYCYMKFLMDTMPKIYKKALSTEYMSAFLDETNEFKAVLEQTGVKITNSNIEYIPDLSYRLYRDSKFFYELSEQLGDKYDEFIEEFEFICNNDPNSVDV